MGNQEPKIAVILAAGEGKRLQPVTYITDKPFLMVGGVPVIDYVLDNLSYPSIKDIYIAVSHETMKNEDKYMKYFQETRDKNIILIETPRWETGGDLKFLMQHTDLIDNLDSPFVVCNGDVITKVDISRVIQSHMNSGKVGTILLFSVPWEDVERFGIAKLENNEIIKFIEKPKKEEAPTNLANAGYYILEPNFLEHIPTKKNVKIEHIFEKLAEERKINGFLSELPYWLDIGTKVAFDQANVLIYTKKGLIKPPGNRNE